jgi:hypothetical protein
MEDGDIQSLLYISSGHRKGGGVAPLKNLSEIVNSKMKEEICYYGK